MAGVKSLCASARRSMKATATETSATAAVTAISNVGPGLGAIGPANTFVELPDTSKWFLSFLMMVGRLEIFTVLTILMPGFWKQ